MIGDGSNDMASIMQANIGICIGRQDNMGVQHISDMVIDNWNKIPQILYDCNQKQKLITNIVGWVLMKHMITAFALVSMLLISNFELIRDPASPYIMSLLNGCMFSCMMIYCQYSESLFLTVVPPVNRLIIKGGILGIINGAIVFTLFDVNQAIYILICIQVIQLIMQLHRMSIIGYIYEIVLALICVSWIICTGIYVDSLVTYAVVVVLAILLV